MDDIKNVESYFQIGNVQDECANKTNPPRLKPSYKTRSYENQEGFYPMSEDEYCGLVHISKDEDWWKKIKMTNYKDGKMIYSSHPDQVRKEIENKLKELNKKVIVEVTLTQPLTTKEFKMVERELLENVDIYLTLDKKRLKVRTESYEKAHMTKYKIEVKLGLAKPLGRRRDRVFSNINDTDQSSNKTKEISKFSLSPNPPSEAEKFGKPLTNVQDKTESCCICLDEIQIRKQLRCGHIFCKGCIDEAFKHKPACPSCGVVYGIVQGNQPTDGQMRVEKKCPDLAGYRGFGHIMITYFFPDGVQGPEHPNEGKHYKGITRSAYLPNNTLGRVVADLLKVAFKRRLVFTIGNSRTTGEEGVILWNDIHHKTSMEGGPQRFGYPDDTYLGRILEELAAKGITMDELTDYK